MFDISGALLGLLMVWPLMLAIAVATRLTDPGPVFYSQSRIGRGGRAFACWKFRTMAVDSHLWFTHYLEMNPEAACEWAEHAKLRDDPRVTRIGRFLRRSSLDELPQLFNILMGDMSFVGPRPVIADELVRYGTGARAYLRTRPGLTGLWQVSGRNDVPYRRRIAMDRRYVARWSMLLDFAILLRTARVVVRGTGY
jgi:exopolysaccharide production protein ExoY